VFEDGRQLRDFVHVRDVARANVTAVESDPAPAGAFNIASGSPISIATMAEILSMSHGPPAAPPVITGDYRRGDVRHVFASPARAESFLGWRAEVAIEEGMKEFAESALRDGQPS
jgi:dTDP-L-rhamnose 4-epimerase